LKTFVVTILQLEECGLLGSGAVWVYYKSTFRSNVSSNFRVEEIIINPHGATSQMTAFFIATAVETSNPTFFNLFLLSAPLYPSVLSPVFINNLFYLPILSSPLRSSGQNSWLQIQRSRFDSQRYKIF
jgi:hypothetical protein